MATINGNNSANTLTGTTSDDSINGLGGNDTIYAHRGDDLVNGGDGNDVIHSGLGSDTIFGGNGNDYILAEGDYCDVTAGAGNDTLQGGWGYDTLDGGDGDDSIDGGDNNDLIYGGLGLDILTGGSGDDSLYGEGGDTLYGGVDWDTLVSFGGNNVLYGEDGIDVLWAGDGGNATVALLYGGTGNDWLVSLAWVSGADLGQAAVMYGGEGDDGFLGGDNNLWAYGEVGNDSMQAGAGSGVKYMSGGEGEDTLDAQEATNGTFYGDAGFDHFFVGAVAGSTNLYHGGSDDDTFFTKESISAGDSLVGGTGYDVFDGQTLTHGISLAIGGPRPANSPSITGFENFYTGSGDDWIDVTQSAVALNSGGGNDLVYLTGSNSNIDLSSGDDTLYLRSIQNSTSNSFSGGGGTDSLIVAGTSVATINLAGGTLGIGTGTANIAGFENAQGASGNDTITGSSLDNWLGGNGGADTISGGGGNDTLDGGAGRDTLTGGAGSDIFVFHSGGSGTGVNADRITDFTKNVDDIDVWGIGGSAFIGTAAFSSVAGQVRYVQSGQNTIIQIDANGDGTADSHIRLDNYSAGLTAADFIF